MPLDDNPLIEQHVTGEATVHIAEDETDAPAATKHNQSTSQLPHTHDSSWGAAIQETNDDDSESDLEVSEEQSADQCEPDPEYRRSYPEELPDWPVPIVPEELADLVANKIAMHTVMSKSETTAITLWCFASYGINCFTIFPKLALVSPEKRCGKTTTMSVIKSICRDGFATANITPAALFRTISLCQVTMLIDEADQFVKGKTGEMVSILNSGHTKATAQVTRCQGDNHEPEVFSTWVPMVLASIGSLQGTIMDRCIVINLRRKKANEKVSKVQADLDEAMVDIRRQIRTWIDSKASELKSSDVPVPCYKGNDRASDNWFPLYQVAALISDKWLQRCKDAHLSLTGDQEPEVQTELLRDIREVLDQEPAEKIRSQDLLSRLLSDPDKPWATMNNGRKMTARVMAKLLKPYGITPSPIRFDNGLSRGYQVGAFQDAFARYLSSEPET